MQERLRNMVWKAAPLLRAGFRYVPEVALRPLANRGKWALLPPGRDILKTNYLGAYRIGIDTAYSLERKICRGRLQPDIQFLVTMLCPQSGVVLDVGANVGCVTLPMAGAVGEAGTVIAFEPSPVYPRLLRNLDLNPAIRGRVIPERLALGQVNEVAEWRENLRNRGNGTLLPSQETKQLQDVLGEGVKVKTVTLDSYVAERGLSRIDMLKVDVEGMEYEVLTGGRETLRRWHPSIVFETIMAVEDIRGRPVIEETTKFLVAFGYKLFSVNDHGLLSEVAYPNLPHDTVAIHPTCLSQDWVS